MSYLFALYLFFTPAPSLSSGIIVSESPRAAGIIVSE